MVLEVVDDVADGRVGAVLEQSHFRALPRPGEVTLQGWRASVEHAVRGVWNGLGWVGLGWVGLGCLGLGWGLV